MSFYGKTPKNARISAYYSLQWKDFSMEPHAHQSCEIMYVLSGKCKIFANEQEFLLRRNQLVFLDERVPHELLVESPCYMMNLEFSCRSPGLDLEPLWAGTPEPRSFWEDARPVKKMDDSSFVGPALRDLISELEKGGEPYLTGLLFQRLLVELSRCRETGNRGIRYLRKARAYIGQHFDEEIRVADVAREAGVSPAYLQTLFAKYENTSVMEIVRDLRLEKACILLRNTRQSVTDIAVACGYNSRQQFGYSFQSLYGKSPREYRNLQGREEPLSTRIRLLEDCACPADPRGKR